MRVALALAAVYLVWGSTYLGIRYAIETLPPLLMAGARFMFAGAVLLAIMRLRGAKIERRHWPGSALVGGLLLLGGNGLVVLAQHHVPSGLAALMVATTPLWLVTIDWLLPGGKRPPARVWVGFAVGMAGMALLVNPAAGAVHLGGAALLFGATLAWAVGSAISRRLDPPASPLVATGMQMFAGGALLFLAGLARGEAAVMNLAGASTRSIVAVAYLVVFGSLVGYSAYVWLLRNASPALASTYAYVNPVVAILLGAAVAGETITSRILLASAVILAGVVLITTASIKPQPKPAPVPAPDSMAPCPPPSSR